MGRTQAGPWQPRSLSSATLALLTATTPTIGTSCSGCSRWWLSACVTDGLHRWRNSPISAMASFCVYIIELNPAVRSNSAFRKRNPDARVDRPCVYVGSTYLDPQVRFEQHKAGVKANRFARKYGVRLRRSRMRFLKGYKTRALAEAAERRCAERLQSRGYAVWWG